MYINVIFYPIYYRIHLCNQRSKKKIPNEIQKENKLLEDTMFISNDIDINKAIEKELQTKEKTAKKKLNSKKEK